MIKCHARSTNKEFIVVNLAQIEANIYLRTRWIVACSHLHIHVCKGHELIAIFVLQ